MMNQANGWMNNAWMGTSGSEAMWVWAVIATLVVVLLVVVITKLVNK